MPVIRKQVSIFIALMFFIVQCTQNEKLSDDQKNDDASIHPTVERDLAEMIEDGTLKAIVGYSSTSYFTYKGEPMGYEFELLQRLADQLSLRLEIVVARNFDDMFRKLNSGEGDLIAFGLTITEPRKKIVNFTEYHTTTEQVLVQRKPDNWREAPIHVTEKQLIRNTLDLLDQEIYVRKHSSYYERLQNLASEMGGTINIQTVPGDVSTEELIRRVQDKEIPYTVADKHIALLNSTYYRDLDVKTNISFPQRLAWAVRKNSPELLTEIDQWIGQNRGSETFNVIYNKYFRNTRSFRARQSSPYFSKSGGAISEYDSIVKIAAKKIDWDWRLLSALIFQESRFDAEALSWAGAAGLMQMLPATAEAHGATDLMNPWESLSAGVSFLSWLHEYWREIKDPEERIKFVLASYNAGQGHVRDAQRLAKKHGKSPYIWDDNVAVYILKKANPEYYTQDVVRYGYCRGEEPFHYVENILHHYAIYRDLINGDD